LLCGIKELEAL